MEPKTLRIAAVELTIVLHKNAGDDLTNSLISTLRDGPTERRRQVQAVIGALRARGVEPIDILVFPGWTLVGRSVPGWFRDAVRGWTTVIEMLASEGGSKRDEIRPWRTHVLSPAGTADHMGVQCAIQRFHEAADAPKSGAKLIGDFDNGTRDWNITDRSPMRGRLLICGEANCVGMRGGSIVPLIRDWNQPEAPLLVVNPAHRPPGSDRRRQQMNAKRQYLAAQGALVTTANRFEFASDFKGDVWPRIAGGAMAFTRTGIASEAGSFSVPYAGSVGSLRGEGHTSHRVHRYALDILPT